MRAVLALPSESRDVDIRAVPTATVGDLAAAVGPDGTGTHPAPLWIDGRQVPPDLGLEEAGLVEGAVVSFEPGDPDPARATGLAVHVVGGLDSGRTVALSGAGGVVGRSPACEVTLGDPSVSGTHCRVVVAGATASVEDLGSRNGTAVDGREIAGPTDLSPGDVITAGASHLRVGRYRVDDRPVSVDPVRHAGPTGLIPFNRPPRPATPPAPAPLQAPAAPTEGTAPPFNLFAVAAPVAFSAVMVVALRNPQYALFALLTPVMAIGNWWQARHRSRRTFRSARGTYATSLRAFERDLDEQRRSTTLRRRAAFPDTAEIVRMATLPSVRLWERRNGHPDWLRLSAGLADQAWSPALAPAPQAAPATEVAEILAERATLPLVPAEVDLSSGGVVGIVGDRAAALALARSLVCQAAVVSGPADIAVAVLTDDAGAAAWDWAKWLPHTRDPQGDGSTRLLAAGPRACEQLVGTLLRRAGDDEGTPRRQQTAGPCLLAIVDDERLIAGRQAPVRNLLRGAAGPVAGVVVARTADVLPAVCTTIIEVDAAGSATLRRPQLGEAVGPFIVGGISAGTARGCARAMARFEDTDSELRGTQLPDHVRLLGLLTPPGPDPDGIRTLWRERRGQRSVSAPVGSRGGDVFTIDLERHGPHGLVGGTTGSGKSEFLRSLVTALAMGNDPDHITFVLIDYKGNSSFPELATLPHTVGTVTDLDEFDAQMGARALRCLEAELRHRKRVLSAAGVPDITSYWDRLRSAPAAGAERPPLPRLLVVIDEFKQMVDELPGFVDALVVVAAQGRSLGVHLILATQKPAGVVNATIRSNTDLRVCLRVTDPPDSTDVIDIPDAVNIVQPGRAYVRLRRGNVFPVQTALVKGRSGAGATAATVEIHPFAFAAPAAGGTVSLTTTIARPVPGPTDLDAIVGAIRSAFEGSGLATPRRVWADPLPRELDLATLPQSADAPPGAVSIALADDPDTQSRYTWAWDPQRGNLLVVGITGSGTTTALASVGLELARRRSPSDLHLYVLDFGAGELAALLDLPHTGAVVGATDRERQVRLVRFLRGEVARRKGLAAADRRDQPDVVLLLDGFGAFIADYNDVRGLDTREALLAVLSGGPEVGVHAALSADRLGSVPSTVSAVIEQKLVLHAADAHDHSAFGLSAAEVPARFIPGRGVALPDRRVVQVARPMPSLAAAVAALPPGTAPQRPPAPIRSLPTEVPVDALTGSAQLDRRPWLVPVGISDVTLSATGLRIFEAEHVIVAGPPRSGKSAALRTIARVVRQAGGVRLSGVAAGRSPLLASADLDETVIGDDDLGPFVDRVLAAGGRHLVLIDDADLLNDRTGAFSRLLGRRLPDVHLVVAGRPDALRRQYGNWIQAVRGSKVGLLLRPDPDLDGELVGVAIPRRQHVDPAPGRGYLAATGETELVQVAWIAEEDDSGS